MRKLWNASKLLLSFYITKYSNKVVQWGTPMTLSFEPTTACNLRCPECPSGLRSFTRPTGNLKSDFFRNSIDQVHKNLIYLIFYFQGEPYINPEFLKMVKYANNKGLYTITSTNGHFLSDDNCRHTIQSGLDRIIISIDGLTQSTYQAYRKEGQLSEVIAGTKRLIAWKQKMKSKTPHIIFQFLVVANNEHEIRDLYKLAEEIGVNEVKLKTAQLYDYKNGHELMPSQEEYSRYFKTEDGTYAIKNTLENHCWKLWHASVITWDGKVLPCCFDKDAKHELGSLQNNNFNYVWKSDAYNNFRKELKSGRENIDICQNCSEGCKVWA